MKFTKATKKKSRARFALIGPSGSGKTWTALLFACHIASLSGGRVAVIDSERGSARKYADVFNFDVLELEDFSPSSYMAALRAADEEGYAVVVVDSLSHAWMGKGGALEMVDRVTAQSKSGNSFDAWRKVTPEHNRLVDSLLALRAHLFVTMRTKTEYVLEENDRGRKVPRKIGLQPVQRDGLEYEFDVVADLDIDNQMVVGKTRCSRLRGGVYLRPDKSVADVYARWLDEGEAAPPPPAPASSPRETAPASGNSNIETLSSVEDFFGAIASATDIETLKKISPRIMKAGITGDALSSLRAQWEARRDELKAKAVA